MRTSVSLTGKLTITARPCAGKGASPPVKPWENSRAKLPMMAKTDFVVDVRETGELSAGDIPVTLDKAIHKPDLHYFLDAIRGNAALNCPGEGKFAISATILRMNGAVAARKMLSYAPNDFTT